MVHVYPGRNWLYSRNDHISEDHITENWPKFDHITGTQCITTCLGSVPALVTDKPCSPCSLRRICEGCFAFRFRRTFKLTIGDPKCNIHFSKGGRSSFPPLVHTLAKGLLLPLLSTRISHARVSEPKLHSGTHGDLLSHVEKNWSKIPTPSWSPGSPPWRPP